MKDFIYEQIKNCEICNIEMTKCEAVKLKA